MGKFKKAARDNSDAGRAEATAQQTLFRTLTWEAIRTCLDWTELSRLYDGDGTSTEARQVRRYIHKLKAAGLVDIRYDRREWERGPRFIEFRVRRIRRSEVRKV